MNEDIYIATVKEQIESGIYDHLLRDKQNLVFMDIGANVGLVSNYVAPYCKRIVALEPAPETFTALKTNLANHPHAECYQIALAPKDGAVDFFVNNLNFTASSTVNTYGTKIIVDGKKLSTILEDCKLTHVDVCKIDAEGAEGESLDYYQIDNAKDIIKTYYIETHNCPKTTWEHKLGTIVGNLARCDYKKMTIDGMSITATRS